jgi:hypothetical protein
VQKRRRSREHVQGYGSGEDEDRQGRKEGKRKRATGRRGGKDQRTGRVATCTESEKDKSEQAKRSAERDPHKERGRRTER